MEEFLAGLGLIVNGPVVLDGEVHRLGTQDKPKNASGWYVGHEVPFKVLVAGDWRKPKKSKADVWKAAPTRVPVAELKRLEALAEEARRKSDAERTRRQITAAEKARERLERARLVEDNSHPYLRAKKIDPTAGIRESGQDLLIPMENKDGVIVGVQSITPEGGKFYQKDQRSKGAVHRIPGKAGDARVYICEGYATGATIHAATGGTVYCALSHGNMPVVAKWIRQNNLDKCITVCADNDSETEGNPGVTSALEAADIALASYVCPPEPGDFNDLYQEQSLDILRSIITKVRGKKSWAPLGKLKGVYYVYDFEKSRIREFNSFSTSEFYELEPLESWQKRYPPAVGSRGKVDWEQAKSDMIQAIDHVGGFIPDTIRGAGVWLEKGGIVYSTGQELFLSAPGIAVTKPIEQKTSHLDGRYILGRGTPLPRLPIEMASLEERTRLVRSIMAFPWSTAVQARHIIGWLIIARMGGCFPIRPYVWLTGPSGSGKSTFLKLIKHLFGIHGHWVQAGTTEPGLRQMTTGTNIPVIYDEFEAGSDATSQQRVQKLLELFRSSWSDDAGQVVKGSVEGAHQTFIYRSPTLVASIRVSLNTDADESRFSICELGSGMRGELDLEWITPEVGGRLLSWSLPMVGQIEEIRTRIRGELLAVGHNDRYADQHSLLLAASEAVGMEPLLDHDAPFADGHEGVDVPVADHVECLRHIYGTPLRDVMNAGSFTIQRLVDKGFSLHNNRQLEDHGVLLIEGEKSGLWIANGHASLEKAFSGSKWVKGWSRSLQRLEGAKPHRGKVAGMAHRGTLIPMETLKVLEF